MIIETILAIIIITLSVTLYYALRRINQYENILLEFQNIIRFASEKVKVVDSKGHYESDDETGFFFEQLKQIQLMLNDLFEPTEGDENAEKKEK